MVSLSEEWQLFRLRNTSGPEDKLVEQFMLVVHASYFYVI